MSADTQVQVLSSEPNFGDVLDVFQSKDYNIRWFMGGSRFFGFDNRGSDWDFFILVTPDMVLPFTKNLGAIRVARDQSTYNLGGLHFEIGSAIDFLIFTNEDVYTELLIEHDAIKSYLNNNQDMFTIMLALKRSGKLSGTEIYRLLLSLVLPQLIGCEE